MNTELLNQSLYNAHLSPNLERELSGIVSIEKAIQKMDLNLLSENTTAKSNTSVAAGKEVKKCGETRDENMTIATNERNGQRRGWVACMNCHFPSNTLQELAPEFWPLPAWCLSIRARRCVQRVCNNHFNFQWNIIF
jgi:hypothetical protein